jgi:type IV secretory pathway VirD2 relaxase
LAVNHFDTDHPHAHLVIRGVDRSGRELRLDRGYISNGLRRTAQEIATEELGPRHDLDIQRAYAREVAQERFTSLDRELERRAVDNCIEVRSRQRPGRIDDSTLVARLEHLEAMRLAERVSGSTWSLQPGWQAELRALGSRGDILKQIHAAVRGDPARYRISSLASPGPPASCPGVSRAKVCPTSSRDGCTPSSRRRRATRSTSRSTRGPPRISVRATSCP